MKTYKIITTRKVYTTQDRECVLKFLKSRSQRELLLNDPKVFINPHYIVSIEVYDEEKTT